MFGNITTIATNIKQHGLSSFLLAGTPEYSVGTDVVIFDQTIRNIIGDDTGTIIEVSCQFGRWEYLIEADDPEGFENRNIEPVSWCTQREIDMYVAEN